MSVEPDFARTVHTHQRWLWWFVRTLGGDPALADDVTQEAFVALFEAKDPPTDDRAVAAWLRTVARRKFMDAVRRQRRDAPDWSRTSDADIEQAWVAFQPESIDSDASIALGRCLEELETRAREALLMQYRDGMTRGEIAAAVGLGENGAIAMLQRAKQTLRECIKRRLGL